MNGCEIVASKRLCVKAPKHCPRLLRSSMRRWLKSLPQADALSKYFSLTSLAQAWGAEWSLPTSSLQTVSSSGEQKGCSSPTPYLMRTLDGLAQECLAMSVEDMSSSASALLSCLPSTVSSARMKHSQSSEEYENPMFETSFAKIISIHEASR